MTERIELTENEKLFGEGTYLQLFFDEKELQERLFEVAPHGTTHFIPSEVVLEHIALTQGSERAQIEGILRQIDYRNGDVNHFLEHLATAIAANYSVCRVL